jgi:hypothetical protein
VTEQPGFYEGWRELHERNASHLAWMHWLLAAIVAGQVVHLVVASRGK